MKTPIALLLALALVAAAPPAAADDTCTDTSDHGPVSGYWLGCVVVYTLNDWTSRAPDPAQD